MLGGGGGERGLLRMSRACYSVVIILLTLLGWGGGT